MKVHELLSDESKWCKGENARNREGRATLLRASDACSWCLTGAVFKCYGLKGYKLPFKQMERRIKNVAHWNDAPERTFAEVRALALELDL